MELRLPKSFIEEEFGKLNFTPQLSKIKIPSLIIYGKYDFVCPPILGQIMYNNISSTDKELIIYEKSAHSPMGHEIGKFKNDVTQFIETYK
jgi:pimeloyl-ACP methyl ester carboxylesterase